MSSKTSKMRVEEDFAALLKYFNKHRVKYCVVGAFAYGFHAQPRYTKDMDILVEASLENGKKIVAAIKSFGFKGLGLAPEDFTQPEQIIQLGQEPVRIDLLTSISGATFKKIWRDRKQGAYGNQKVHFISLQDLIKAKEAAGRLQDKADLELLNYIRKEKRIKK